MSKMKILLFKKSKEKQITVIDRNNNESVSNMSNDLFDL
jgi:hypothetical protein